MQDTRWIPQVSPRLPDFYPVLPDFTRFLRRVGVSSCIADPSVTRKATSSFTLFYLILPDLYPISRGGSSGAPEAAQSRCASRAQTLVFLRVFNGFSQNGCPKRKSSARFARQNAPKRWFSYRFQSKIRCAPTCPDMSMFLWS